MVSAAAHPAMAPHQERAPTPNTASGYGGGGRLVAYLSQVALQVGLAVRRQCTDESRLRSLLALQVSVPERDGDGRDDGLGPGGPVLERRTGRAAVQCPTPPRG